MAAKDNEFSSSVFDIQNKYPVSYARNKKTRENFKELISVLKKDVAIYQKTILNLTEP